MKKQNIEWKDLPKRYALFTKRSTTMIDLDTGKIVRHFSANTRLNMVQQAMFNGERYFRSASAVENGLNLAIKASSFVLPSDDAPLEPLETQSLKTFSPTRTPRSSSDSHTTKQKCVQNIQSTPSENGEKVVEPRKRKGFFRGILRIFSR